MRFGILVCWFCLAFVSPAWAETAAGLVLKGEAALSAHDAATAMKDFDQALELDPKNGQAAFNRAKMRLIMGETAGAIADFTTAAIADPKNAAAFDGRGEAKLKLKQPDPKGAFADFQSAIDATPDKPDPLVVRASYFFQFRNVAGAKADLEKARTLASGATAEAIDKMLARLN
jgi:tetratricopeptide (TPR) repeat protein